MTTLAFLPEIAAAAVALFAAKAGDRLRVPFKRNRCEDAEQKAVVWSYNPEPGTAKSAWRPVMRGGAC